MIAEIRETSGPHRPPAARRRAGDQPGAAGQGGAPSSTSCYDVKADGWFNVVSAAGDTADRRDGGRSPRWPAGSATPGRPTTAPPTTCCARSPAACGVPGPSTRASRSTGPPGAASAWRPGAPSRRSWRWPASRCCPPEAGVAWIRRELTAHASAVRSSPPARWAGWPRATTPTGGLDPVAVRPRGGPLVGEAVEASLLDGLVVRTTLDPDDQPFLDDHRIDGTPVLPGVMGMEAFAEAARLLVPEWHVVAVEDVDFLTPVKFYRDEPRTLTITARRPPRRRGPGGGLPARGRAAAAGQRHTAAHGALHRLGPAVAGRRRVPRGRAGADADGRGTPGIEPARRLPPLLPRSRLPGRRRGLARRRRGGRSLRRPPPRRPAPGDARRRSCGPRLVELCFQVAGLWEAGREGRLALPRTSTRLAVLDELATERAERRGRGGPPGRRRRRALRLRGPRRRRAGAPTARRLPHRALAGQLPDEVRLPLRDVMA